MISSFIIRLTHACKRIVLVLFVVAIILFSGWCVIVEYTRANLSSWAYLKQLSGSENGISTEYQALQALKERLPFGSSSFEIEIFLQKHGVPKDTFTGGQFYRYQISKTEILAILSDPPWSYSPFCSQNTYFVRFTLDSEAKLTDILIDSSGACL